MVRRSCALRCQSSIYPDSCKYHCDILIPEERLHALQQKLKIRIHLACAFLAFGSVRAGLGIDKLRSSVSFQDLQVDKLTPFVCVDESPAQLSVDRVDEIVAVGSEDRKGGKSGPDDKRISVRKQSLQYRYK